LIEGESLRQGKRLAVLRDEWVNEPPNILYLPKYGIKIVFLKIGYT